MKRIANYLLTATALLGAAALLTFAAKNDFGLARNMEIAGQHDARTVGLLRRRGRRRPSDGPAPPKEWCGGSTPTRIYMPEEEMTDFELLTTGKYGGVGALIRKKGDGVVDRTALQGLARPTAPGCRSATRSVAIDGQGRQRHHYRAGERAVSRVTPGSKVTSRRSSSCSTARRSRTVKLRRERIAIPGVRYAGWVADGIGYIQPPRLYRRVLRGYARRHRRGCSTAGR